MTAWLGQRFRPSFPRPPATAQRRSRWPVLASALMLLWCAWWYCRGESQGLLLLTALVSALAVLRARALPRTARWAIWSGLVITVACLAANVARLVPPESAAEETRAIDRIITVAFAMGLTGLFFRPSIDGVTLAAVGGVPMVMVVLSRAPAAPGSVAGSEQLLIWGLVGLLMAADLAQRLTRPPGPGEPPERGVREWAWRAAVLAAVAALAFGLRVPVERAARGVQKGLMGWMVYSERPSKRRAGDLLLALPPPANFGTRTRVVLLLRAGRLPGYLREQAYTQYRGGRWLATRPELALQERRPAPADVRGAAYALTPAPAPASAERWRADVVSPDLLDRFALPGDAVTLFCEGEPPLSETNGTVAAKGRLPERYELAVARGHLLESAYPLPAGSADPAYLDVPAPLAAAVSNWVAACPGLAGAPSTAAAVRCLEEHFVLTFTYRLGVRVRQTPDPLIDFMARKEGACTLFASAATLMFRSGGRPARLVNGYVCSGWNPWLKQWVVRERDAHAWVEVWDRESGRWLVADPTPPDGNPASFRKPGRVRLALDLLVAGWKRALAYLRGANILAVIADAGALLAEFVSHALLSLPGLAAAIGLGAVWWLRRRSRRRALTDDERLRAELVRLMEARVRRAVPSHARRRQAESWPDWLLRVGPELAPERRRELAGWIESYEALRYSPRLDAASVRAWMAAARR